MEEKESSVRISLVDVLYGVVLGYGFIYFDKAESLSDYFRVCFAYSIIIIDWIYVHRLYWGWGYKYNIMLLLDIGVIFTVSRLLYTSTDESLSYISWLSVLFVFYLVWDLVSRCLRLPTEYDWRYSLWGDFLGAVCFVVMLWFIFTGYVSVRAPCVDIAIIAIYFLVFATWFKKA